MGDYVRRTEQMFRTAMPVGMVTVTPDALKSLAADGLARSRAATERMTQAALEAGRAMEKATGVAHSGVHAISERVMTHLTANTMDMFATAEAMMKARSLPEAAQMQAEFMRNQFMKAGEQTRDIVELGNAIARTTAEQFASAARAFTPVDRG